ncbi:MAG: ABC transporter permease [Deltaproteobacteria bacterium]|nr:ABC transporter permease [Deltaproteobacteria bacterium]
MSSHAFSRKIALRYLWSRRGEAFITIITIISVLGVAIGVMVLNMVMAVMTGFQHELREKIVGTNSHIVVRRLSGKIQDWQEVSHKIADVPGVTSVSAFTYHQALLRTQTGSTGILIRGIEQGTSAAAQLAGYVDGKKDIDALFNPPPVLVSNEMGEQESVSLPGLVVGKELVRSLGLIPGSPVSLLSPTMTSSPFGLMPKFRRFTIAGVYNSGLVEYESGLAYASLSEAQKFFNMGNSVSGLEVRVKNIDESPRVAKAIVEALGGLSSGFYAQDWTETNKPLWDAMKLEKKVYFIVLLLIVVMASFSIISTLIMIVLEKRKDIAVLKTMGATTASISRIFILQGSVIGGVGTLAGLAGGYLGCLALQKYGFPLDERIFQMSTVPVRMEFANFALVGLTAFCICFLATIYPARRASSLEPSEVLRYE